MGKKRFENEEMESAERIPKDELPPTLTSPHPPSPKRWWRIGKRE